MGRFWFRHSLFPAHFSSTCDPKLYRGNFSFLAVVAFAKSTIMDDSERQRLEKKAQRDSYFGQRKTNDDEVKLYEGRS